MTILTYSVSASLNGTLVKSRWKKCDETMKSRWKKCAAISNLFDKSL